MYGQDAEFAVTVLSVVFLWLCAGSAAEALHGHFKRKARYRE